ncbi:MAG: polyphosphate kinase 1 [Bacteroidetes bacterium]|nr:polyphosphate kinase 1 [Bacteroidota bacterium]MBS1630567.1 polyphosphate kinase 1 [Bacteroidota bacterium]
MKSTHKTIVRDLSWLSFNARVLQEARDATVPLSERLRFIGIYSNNLDEFFRVRVAALERMLKLGKSVREHLEEQPAQILKEIQYRLLMLQQQFDETYADIITCMAAQGIFIKTPEELTETQRAFARNYFDQEVRTQLVPLMLESIPGMPLLNDKSIYLACVLASSDALLRTRYALIAVPNRLLPRFVILPSGNEERHVILLEDIMRMSLPQIFAPFGYDRCQGYLIKVTRDAELDIDNDLSTNQIEAIEKSLKARKRGRANRFVYDRSIDAGLFDYLIRRLNLSGKDYLVPGGRIHNFKDFMDFPASLFRVQPGRRAAFVHPLLSQPCRIMKVLDARDVMLHFPYHSFDSLIDLVREASIDPFVQGIKITGYRLAKDSKLIHALINAVRNGKQVSVVLELRARFDEEANLAWKRILEEEGVRVFIGQPYVKVHAKLCLIRRREAGKTKMYGFISTGNFNEKTACYYSDHCLLTANRHILADAGRVFDFLMAAHPEVASLQRCKTMPVSPWNMRRYFMNLIAREIKAARKKKPASLIIKLNSLSDELLINQLYEAARAGVQVDLIIRSICGAYTQQKSFRKPMKAISIVDEYLEHARVFVFHNAGKRLVFISSADWMLRNLDHRIEVACPIFDPEIQQELEDILKLQSAGNVKARILDNEQRNAYVPRKNEEPEIRAQLAIYDYLLQKKYPDSAPLHPKKTTSKRT